MRMKGIKYEHNAVTKAIVTISLIGWFAMAGVDWRMFCMSKFSRVKS